MRGRRLSSILVAAWSLWASAVANAAAPASALDNTRVLDAARRGDLETIKQLIAARADVNAKEGDGATALAWAAYRDDLQTVDLLLAAGADPNAANEYGVTPLALACTNRNATMVEHLLNAGANPNAAKWTGETVLMSCVNSGATEAVEALIRAGADVNAKENKLGQTALMWAAAKKEPEIVRLLTAHGADIHARSKLVPTPEPFSIPCTPAQPCLTGRKEGSTYAPEVHFPKTKGGFTAFLFTAQQGDIESAKILLDAGADVNESAPEYGSALVIASASGREDYALFLLDRGADPNAKDAWGITPLHYALHEGLLSISSYKPEPTDRFGWERPNMPRLVKALLAKGANPNARIEFDFPPYDYAPIARSNGNNLPQISLVGATPFFLAAACGEVGIMRTLVEARANPRIATQDGSTPLMVAAGLAHERGGIGFGGQRGEEIQRSEEQSARILEAVRMAFELGNDVNAVNQKGQTALHAAVFMGEAEVIKFLVEKGANLEAKDKYGQTPMTIALGDPEGLVYRQLGGGRYDYSFRQPKEQKDIAELLLALGAKPFTGKKRDRSGE